MKTHEEKIKDIKDALDDITFDPEMPTKYNGEMTKLDKWTKAVKRQLTSLGKSYDYEVAPDREKSDRREKREWLYDLTWWRCQNDERNDRTSIELAVESEWNNDLINLKIDFAKLVYARAKLKLFIFRAKDEAQCKEILHEMKELAEMCEDANDDKYLLSCYIEDGRKKFMHYENHS